MNILEHYIDEIIEKRSLNAEEIKEALEAGVNPEEWIYVKWRYNCWGTKQLHEDLYRKDQWTKIEEQGFAWM